MTTPIIVPSLVSCATLPVLSGSLELPLMGAWTATLEVDADAPPTGHVDITFAREDGKLDTYYGTVLYGHPWQGRSKVVVVGGRGNLTLPTLSAKNYVGSPSVTSILNEILNDTANTDSEREGLADGVEDALAGFSVNKWVRAATGAGKALTRLAGAFGMRWRVQQDGLVWMGAELWPTVTDPFTVDPGDDGVARFVVAAPDTATYAPGCVIFGQRINRVVYTIDSNTLRMALHYGVDVRSESDRDDAERFVRSMLPELPYLASFDAQVLLQHADGTLDVRCDDASIGELARVPFRPGIPGANVTIDAGDHVRVHFASAAPDSYYAVSPDQDTSASRGLARFGDLVTAGTLSISPGPPPLLVWKPAAGGTPVGPLSEVDLTGGLIVSASTKIKIGSV